MADERVPDRGDTARQGQAGEITLASFGERRDWQASAEAYMDASSGASAQNREEAVAPVCCGSISDEPQVKVERPQRSEDDLDPR